MHTLKLFGRILIASFIVLVLYLFCTMTSQDESRPEISPALEPYVQSWEDDMRKSDIHYSQAFNRIEEINVVSTGEDYAGLTDILNRRIWINLKQVESGELRTLCTVYHELGHFVFKLDHNSCEIMQEKCPSEEYLQENWVDLLQEYRDACAARKFEAKQ